MSLGSRMSAQAATPSLFPNRRQHRRKFKLWADACVQAGQSGQSLGGVTQPAPANADKAGSHICVTCGAVGYPKAESKGSFLIGFLLLLCFIVPGVLYLIYCMAAQRWVCPTCGSREVVPLNTPRGQKLLSEMSNYAG
jgi:hypothetical protein